MDDFQVNVPVIVDQPVSEPCCLGETLGQFGRNDFETRQRAGHIGIFGRDTCTSGRDNMSTDVQHRLNGKKQSVFDDVLLFDVGDKLRPIYSAMTLKHLSRFPQFVQELQDDV